MTPLQWFFMFLATAILISIALIEVRNDRRKRRQVDTALKKRVCPSCGGSFASWAGEKSANHYNFVEGLLIEDVISVTCARCKKATDAFLLPDGTVELQPPW